ncbi:MAG: hypothetical protein ABSH40_16275 [Bryobacteraceae bacterium]
MPCSSPIRPWFRIALLLYGALNAVLYAGLLPLWEGFDEPFHYGYVQELSRRGALPVLGKTVLSEEVVRSLDLVPAGYAVARNVGRGVVFGDYFRMPAEQRRDLRRRLEQIDPASAAGDSQSPNYESNHPPLAYALLAPFDALWASVQLPARVLRLRLLGALAAVLLLWFATWRLCALLELPDSIPLAAMFVVFSSQMFYGAVCHIANDWLAVPLFTLVLSEAVALYRQPRPASGIRLALALAAGLLTKAYFLAAVPFAAGMIALCCWRRKLPWTQGALSMALALGIAAPWYIRNLVLYQNLSGMQETMGGTPFGELVRAAAHIPWVRAALVTARSSLWTGNNSVWALGRNTTRVMLGLLIGALCVYLWRAVRGRVGGAERVVLAGTLCYTAALAYSAVLTYWSTRGAGISPAPWYVQVLLAPGLCLLFIGLSQNGWAGRAWWLAMVWTWTYVIAISYGVKLIPFYAGFTTGTAHLSDLPRWYARFLSGSYGTLDTAALLPPGVLLAMAAAVVTMAVTLAAVLSVISFRNFFLPPWPFRWTLKD